MNSKNNPIRFSETYNLREEITVRKFVIMSRKFKEWELYKEWISGWNGLEQSASEFQFL